MSLILNIETSTSVCSVALSEGEEVVFEKASFEGPVSCGVIGRLYGRGIRSREVERDKTGCRGGK